MTDAWPPSITTDSGHGDRTPRIEARRVLNVAAVSPTRRQRVSVPDERPTASGAGGSSSPSMTLPKLLTSPVDTHELSSYPTSSAHPLLAQDPTPPSPSSRNKRRVFTSRFNVRWSRPLLIITLPLVLLAIYALLHPHLPGLPTLPRVVFQPASQTAHLQGVSTIYAEDSECTCGHTVAGERLCSVYNPQTLRATRLVQGTGARVRRMLLAGREGKALKVGILGGSGERSWRMV